jgi:hypothetical protein
VADDALAHTGNAFPVAFSALLNHPRD